MSSTAVGNLYSQPVYAEQFAIFGYQLDPFHDRRQFRIRRYRWLSLRLPVWILAGASRRRNLHVLHVWLQRSSIGSKGWARSSAAGGTAIGSDKVGCRPRNLDGRPYGIGVQRRLDPRIFVTNADGFSAGALLADQGKVRLQSILTSKVSLQNGLSIFLEGQARVGNDYWAYGGRVGSRFEF